MDAPSPRTQPLTALQVWDLVKNDSFMRVTAGSSLAALIGILLIKWGFTSHQATPFGLFIAGIYIGSFVELIRLGGGFKDKPPFRLTLSPQPRQPRIISPEKKEAMNRGMRGLMSAFVVFLMAGLITACVALALMLEATANSRHGIMPEQVPISTISVFLGAIGVLSVFRILMFADDLVTPIKAPVAQ